MKKLIKYLKDNGINFELKGDNLTVGCSLDLKGTGITSLPDNLILGSSLYLQGT